MSFPVGREFRTYWTENLGPKFWEAFAAGSAGKCGLGAGALALEMLSCGKPIPGSAVQVRSMLVPGCAWRCPQISGAARRGAVFTLCKRGKMRPPFSFFEKENAPRPVEEKERDAAL